MADRKAPSPGTSRPGTDHSAAAPTDRRARRARIVTTLGPASDTPERIEALWRAGADVFRLNMSHGDLADKAAYVRHIRAVEARVGRPIAIMADLQGPKLRVGRFADGAAELVAGAAFRLDLDDTPGDTRRVHLPHREIFQAIDPGHRLLLNDGQIALRVEHVDATGADTTVLVGGRLSDRKGVNVPDIVLPVPALTDKDRRDLDAALEMGADWVALSFVQRAEDVAEARKLIAGRAGVLAKIEKPSAVEQIDAILDLADAVMVARGDLGVELPVEDVPGAQKRIILAAAEAGKPVVVATQMLESMIQAPVPTRAEVSDVANAVEDGADAVMLSAESAAGRYPVEAVTVMDRVIRRAEGMPEEFRTAAHAAAQPIPQPRNTAEDAITSAAGHVAQTVRAAAIVSFTSSGSTALRVARQRPRAPILALTPHLAVARRLCLVWGLHTVKTRDVHDFEEMVAKSRRMALRHGFTPGGDRIVVTAGVPFGTPGATNVLHIAWVTGEELSARG
ncbi:pyruvate kinase [Rhodothalassium salexigens DSM 2132]|uniref:Pyruvate kinase n=1 Tax=Rhodothalassium salexigens DSM 2132 TaxID=1188247 RepID=A0A4R2PQT2_RHOSA|nr:pyruvate kinase [Rhodothalassium salexigens]MBB4210887.1 pyruvate kinase [Rhodothalassium salexigens DSM 2132]MBK1638996.1 pyruvate kinase [Rhodothalassium salexigens DSM 2132]TCP36455.1 pyruvate kinase [Rhodothalassium salexigens DSM 2132]